MNTTTLQKSHHVTAVISHRVRPGREAGYEAWMQGIVEAAREFEGYLGVSVLRPQPGSAQPDYVVVLQFDTCDRLLAWLRSDIRKGWIERSQPLVQAQEDIQILTGLESWFQLPQQPPMATPKRYKQALLVWVAVMLMSLLINPWVQPLLSLLPGILTMAVMAAINVALLSYLIMPQLTRVFQRWLFT
ncbi:MAG TPA: antibiotic biosynthesis monooxygenase [Candidatus Obscuribacterales bacterium]